MSAPQVKTPDTGYLVTLARNGFGDVSVDTENEVKCGFFQQFNQQNATNEELTQSDAYAYIDINNAFAKGLGYELQGLYFKINQFGATDQWYIITTVEVAQRKLLTNDVNNVMITLQIVAPPTGA